MPKLTYPAKPQRSIQREKRVLRDKLAQSIFGTKRDFDNASQYRVCREAMFAPSSLVESERSVMVVLSTDTPVRIYDWENDRVIDEILLPQGCRLESDSVPFVDRHNDMDNSAVLGSVDRVTRSQTLEGRITFSAASDVEPLFVRVKEGHLKRVSVGGTYELKDCIEIAPGRSRTIRGTVYTATDVPLRIARIWTLIHVGLVPAGADPKAIMRSKSDQAATNVCSDKENLQNFSARNESSSDSNDQPSTNRRSRTMRFSNRALKFLRSLGLAANANHEAAVTFARSLTATQLNSLTRRDPNTDQILGLQTTGKTKRQSQSATGDQSASDQTNMPPARSGRSEEVNRSSQGGSNGTTDRETILREEHARIRAIRQLAMHEVPEAVVQRACDDPACSVDDARKLFYDEVKSVSRKSSPSHDARGSTGIHIKRGPTWEALQGALIQRQGLSLDDDLFASKGAKAMIAREAKWLIVGAGALKRKEAMPENVERAFDQSDKYADRSIFDILKLALRAKGMRVPSSREEVIRQSFSMSDLPRLFGPVVNGKILEGYQEAPDTTIGWVAREDWQDFRTNELIGVDPVSAMRKLTPRVEAAHIELKERGDKLTLERYAGQFVLDEMDIINDRFGVANNALGFLGGLARKIPQDMVYARLLSNPTLGDGVAMFHASRGNLLSGAFSPDNIEVLESQMATQTITGSDGIATPINIALSWLIVGRKNRLKAKKYVGSTSRTDVNGNDNVLRDEFSYTADSRIDKGCVNPVTGAFVAGAPNRYFMATQNGQFGIQLGYRTGTGRSPRTRSMMLNVPGRWGMAWDVNMDVGIGNIGAEGIGQGE